MKKVTVVILVTLVAFTTATVSATLATRYIHNKKTSKAEAVHVPDKLVFPKPTFFAAIKLKGKDVRCGLSGYTELQKIKQINNWILIRITENNGGCPIGGEAVIKVDRWLGLERVSKIQNEYASAEALEKKEQLEAEKLFD